MHLKVVCNPPLSKRRAVTDYRFMQAEINREDCGVHKTALSTFVFVTVFNTIPSSLKKKVVISRFE